MKDKKVYRIEGIPQSLKRPRFVNGKVWNSQKELFLVYGIYLKGQHEGLTFYNGPLEFDITFYFPLTGKKKDKPPYWHKFRPDLDNLIKMVLDCSQSVLFQEDCVVSSITAKKVYDLVPRTEFTITELERK